ncbi:ABC transporter permease [Sphingorhabdus sp. Alg239-R122]|uniref:ABC transporter permease n=1 Tax=Sphingorhabdus sp. Alg239-R122 TaxID=2305989 RepID=UPI0013DB4D15|nr:ABC transporter permease [Sphingorhabdus sp. Alg239-R122]
MKRSLSSRLSAWLVNISIAMTALRTNLMRSILTTLGVMIGVFAVTLAVGVGSGAQVSVLESINSLGSNMALVFPQPDGEGGRRSFERGRLTTRDARAIEREIDGVTDIAPQLRVSITLVASGNSTSTSAIGATPAYGRVSNVAAEQGRFITDADVRTAARVVVLGTSTAESMFGDYNPVGESLRINRIPFKVIGVLESKGSSFGNDNDDIAIMPLSTVRQRFVGDTLAGPDDLHILFVGFQDGVQLSTAKREMTDLLRDRYKVRGRDGNPFTIRTTEEFIEETGQVTGIFQTVLVAIASISLLVGGIGIMNIMLVSVTERTREIGLRMALGAKKSDIRNQFLVEAAVLCVIGGAMGLLLAIAAGRVLTAYADFPVPIGLGVSIGAIIFSALVGLVFGGWPAVRASRLSPIEALRTE